MNENREISAESQHNFHFLPHLNSKTAEPIFIKFFSYIEQAVELLMHKSARRWCISFQSTRVKSKDGHF